MLSDGILLMFFRNIPTNEKVFQFNSFRDTARICLQKGVIFLLLQNRLMSEEGIWQSQNDNREQVTKNKKKPEEMEHDHWCNLEIHSTLEGHV